MKYEKWISEDDIDWTKMEGLVPVVVQDIETKDVLMLAYANREAVIKTLDTNLATYWSRSRDELWTKGLTSGNTQYVKQIFADCDEDGPDALLYLVEPKGPACHTNNTSCFFREIAMKGDDTYGK
ncbi:MAG: phosphoribosyl-AMP cyclohydrolase [DPANN group archaeon]|nr:phosphoribosyl-AMP cyclohydrolase [DPANN group archaeon]